MKYLFLLFTLIFFWSVFSCTKTEDATPLTQAEFDDSTIQAYITNHNLTAIKHNTGLYYHIKTSGTGANPKAMDSVAVHYKGFLTNGTSFDGTTTTPRTFLLGSLIPAWQIGIPLIKKGGEIDLYAPSHLGYGPNAVGPIPPNSVLIFNIQLVNIK